MAGSVEKQYVRCGKLVAVAAPQTVAHSSSSSAFLPLARQTGGGQREMHRERQEKAWKVGERRGGWSLHVMVAILAGLITEFLPDKMLSGWVGGRSPGEREHTLGMPC